MEATVANRRPRWRLWLGISISIVALALVFYRIEWDAFVRSIQGVQGGYILLGIACFGLNVALRAVRWQILLRPLGRFRLARDSFAYYMIGYMANMLLPLRAGEVIRPYLFGRNRGVAKTAVLATVVAERLFDILSLVAMLAILTAAMEIPQTVRQSAYVVEGGAVLLFAVLWASTQGEPEGNRLGWLLRPFPEGVRKKLAAWVASSALGFRTLHDARAIGAVLFWSLLMWLSSVLVVQSYLWAFGFDLPWYAPVLVIVVSNLGMMIPSSPGFVGVAHFLYVFSLSMFGVDKGPALAFAITLHGISFLAVVVLGMLCLWWEGLSFSQVTRAGSGGDEQP